MNMKIERKDFEGFNCSDAITLQLITMSPRFIDTVKQIKALLGNNPKKIVVANYAYKIARILNLHAPTWWITFYSLLQDGKPQPPASRSQLKIEKIGQEVRIRIRGRMTIGELLTTLKNDTHFDFEEGKAKRSIRSNLERYLSSLPVLFTKTELETKHKFEALHLFQSGETYNDILAFLSDKYGNAFDIESSSLSKQLKTLKGWSDELTKPLDTFFN
jgi:hypothetical protein